ncbi:hypothetical protein TrVE_jg13628 [Triparma verrucosa]|uniref:Uncharacterized protein n=1 Tax=Triparma verrucosa TaxID=1606542 RepID=A0A9W7BCP6_9STRA|nr:hypothetical protein TrVE_jg13628 [Triparma verrucosa]
MKSPSAIERACNYELAAQAPAVNHDCLVTSMEQVDSFCALLQTAESRAGSRSPSSPFPALQIPVEWIIDICDEQNGWFIGTAYAYMEKVGDNGKIQGFLHVVVPDNSNPTWSGNVQVEYRSLRLLECCDKSSQALFTEIVRGSLVPIDWHVEWCDTEDGGEEEEEEAFFTEGEAVYLIRLMNSLITFPLAEDGARLPNSAPKQVMCDANLRLLKCRDGLSHEARKYDNRINCSGVLDFERLVTEGVVDWSGEAPAPELYKKSPVKQASASSAEPDPFEPQISQVREAHLQKLTSLYLDMRECMGHALGERERCVTQRKEMVQTLVKFLFGGEIMQGEQLMLALEADPGKNDPTADSMSAVSRISKVLSELSREAQNIFTDIEVRKTELRVDLKRIKSKVREARAKEQELLERRREMQQQKQQGQQP